MLALLTVALARPALMMNVRRDNLESILRILPALQTPTVASLSDPDWVDVNTIIDESVVRQIVPHLKSAGARGISRPPLMTRRTGTPVSGSCVSGASKTQEWVLRTISLDTISSVLYSKIPFRLLSAAALNTALISSTVAVFLMVATTSVTEPVATGTRRECAAIFPFR